MRRALLFVSLLLVAVVIALAEGQAAEPTKGSKAFGPEQKQWDEVVDKAVKYLKDMQEENGGWSTKQSPGITGLVVTGILETGKVTDKDPTVESALKYIEGLINPDQGHIAGKGSVAVQLQNYVTAVNVLALTTAKRDTFKPVVKDAVAFLKKLQWDEGHGKTKQDDFFGGAGYDSKSRPDLSNTQFFVDALISAGVSKDDPALKNALIFITRCQNLTGEEANDQAWAKKFNDGSFIYSAAAGGQSKADDKDPVGYGSMTYAGIKSMIYCGVSKDDKRIQKAYEWVRKNYTVEANPGMPEVRSQWGLYYYYHTMAKCLTVMEIDEVEDMNGKKHDWRADITAALAKRQKKDGSWANEKDKWMEGDPNVDTSYALMALSYCKPKK
jgi:squalene-hopene/tetraprenyl-beta-curcumene cyclase